MKNKPSTTALAATTPATRATTVRTKVDRLSTTDLPLERVGQNDPDTRARLQSLELMLLQQMRARQSTQTSGPRRASIVRALQEVPVLPTA